MIRKTFAILASALALVPSTTSQPAGPGSSPQPSSDSFTLNPLQWYLRYSAGVSDHPVADGAGWSFDFPVYDQPPMNCNRDRSCGHVNYVTTPVNAAITAAMLTMNFRIETTGAPVFQYALKSDNICTNSAAVRLFIQRRGDTLEADHEFYRWWSKSDAKLAPGAATLTVPLMPDQWMSVLGKPGDLDQSATEGFRAALQNAGNIGMTFGGGCFAGHGVNISGGTARFSLTSYRII